MYDISVTQSIIVASETRVQRLLRWYAQQPVELRIEAHKLAADLFFQYRDKYPEAKNEVRYATFVLAVLKMYDSAHAVSHKDSDHDIDKIRKTTELLADRFLAEKRAKTRRKKLSKKKNQVMDMWAEIQFLRSKGFSWRNVSEFLAKKRRVKIHWTYLQKIGSRLDKQSSAPTEEKK